MKALISKVQDVIKLRKKLTKKQSIGLGVVFALIVFLLVVTTWVDYYYDKTGRYPFSSLNRPEYILPPESLSEKQTYEQVIDFIRSDDTDTIPYEFGFNCIDATFRIWRNATWKGITSYPIVVQYNELPGHMVISFPTNDRGDVFIEPQNDLQIKLRVGQNYNGRMVKGIYALGYAPVPLDDSPPFDPNIIPE